MLFHAFQNKLEKEIKRHFPNGVEVIFKEVEAGNGIFRKGVEINDGKKQTIPIFDAEELYEEINGDESRMEVVVGEMVSQYNALKNTVDEEFNIPADIKKVEQDICFRLVNSVKNKELLMNVPYKKWMDLAVVPYLCRVKGEDVLSLLITYEQMEQWNINEKYIFERAEENTPVKYPVQIKELQEESGSKIYVLSNEQMRYGAAAILYNGIIKEFADNCQDDIYIIPASVNEMVLVTAEGNLDKAEAISEALIESAVAEEDMLSESVYIYKRDTNTVEII